jgi:hypothetical protein
VKVIYACHLALARKKSLVLRLEDFPDQLRVLEANQAQ